MSRGIPAALAEQVEAPVLRPFLAVRIELPDPVTAWTGIGTLLFDDSDSNEREWLGAGGVAAIDAIGETTDGSATGIKVSLFEVPADLAPDVADQATKGALFEVYVGALDVAMQAVEAVHLIWRGRVDQYNVIDAGDTLTVEVTGESRAIDQGRPAVLRFSDADQQRRSAGDRAFEYLPRMTEVSVVWAQASQDSTSGGGAGGGGGFGYGKNVNRL